MRDVLRGALEGLGWWAGLLALWVTLIGPVDTLELAVGAGSALVAAWAARSARRAAAG
ncbi:hypothetical protein ACFY1P_04620 [Streptomyces sp. NPDC001407]|uniref:hypothetical protein n=1 Tax=unclassified Streptomyces TaxID=2593676 RepID=UPI0033D52417